VYNLWSKGTLPSYSEDSFSTEVFKLENELADYNIESNAIWIIIVRNGRFIHDYTHFIPQFRNAFQSIVNLVLNLSLKQENPYPV
jgi:hypothetical protein